MVWLMEAFDSSIFPRQRASSRSRHHPKGRPNHGSGSETETETETETELGNGAGVGAPARQGTQRRPADPPGPTPPRRGPRGRHHPDQQPVTTQALDRPPTPAVPPHEWDTREAADLAAQSGLMLRVAGLRTELEQQLAALVC